MSLVTKLLPLILLSSTALAESSESCGVLSNYKQIIACAEQRSPDVVKADFAVKQKAASVEAASQLLNPELSIEALSGTVDSETRSETDVSLAFPIELGGKRAARKNTAAGNLSQSELELFNAKAAVRKNVFLKILRLRQIEAELDLVNESIEAFGKLVKQYKVRPALSPEQEVTLTLFKVAKDEYSFKRMEYDEELLALESYFQITTGQGLASIKKALPPRIGSFPKVADENPELESSPVLASLKADLQIALAELDQAHADAWPVLSLGPSAKFSKESGKSIQQWGVNLSMPLPILSLNQGAKSASAASVKMSEVRRDLAVQELRSHRAYLVEVYRKSAQALQETANSSALDSKHKKVESLFVKGLIPSSLVIEAHRSLVEFEKTRNTRELKAAEALLDLALIDGKDAELNL
jgi:cobalt-zinc-cadmium efflux system outer membrane protein